MKALIALEDGKVFEARSFTGPGEAQGEIVFNTAMAGYQEIITDPSCHGQIVTFTYPLIGNYGVNAEDAESPAIHAGGVIIGECSRIASNWRSTQTFPEYLRERGILGVDRVDCRDVTLHIRSQGAMKCVISTEELDAKRLVQRAKDSPGLIGRDLCSEVSAKKHYVYAGSEKNAMKVAVLDCGMKENQLRIMRDLNMQLHVFPHATPVEEILAIKPDGLFVSNGPGDPSALRQTISNIRKIVETGVPTFGICLGHQLIALAFGAKVYKLKFGHRGGNQPVIELATGKVEITAQNHSFAVDMKTLPPEIETTHLNLNDNTSEGQRHKKLPIFSVQYHPEAAPGPGDAAHLFDTFQQLVSSRA